MSTLAEQIAAAASELNELEAKGEESFNDDALRNDEKKNAYREAIAERNKKSPSGTPGYPARARQLGIPANLIERCGRPKKDGNGTCTQPAGAGTDHYGTGPCKYHGGINGSTTHGRYSGLFSKDLDDIISHFGADENPLDLIPDIVLIRSLTEKFIANYDVWFEAVCAWHESFNEGRAGPSKPTKVLELTDVYKLLETLSKAVERERKARAENAISQRDLYRIVNHIGVIIETYVSDEETLKKIREQILSIRHA